MVEFGLEVYGGHGRACVCVGVVFQGDWRKLFLSLSLSLRWWVLEMSVCHSRELEEGVEWSVVCAVRYMVRRRAL